jgi:hypothetical protein
MRVVQLALIAFVIGSLAKPAAVHAQSYKRAYASPELPLESAFEAAMAPSARGIDGEPAFAPFPGIFAIPRFPTTLLPLPVPVDPNDLLMQDAFNRADFGAGYAIQSAPGAADPMAVFRLVPNVKLDLAYDTGNPGSANPSPSTIALEGSEADRASGIFSMQQSSVNLKTDVQVPTVAAQVYMEIQADGVSEALDFRQIFGRAGDWLGGEYYSSFVDNGTLPQSIVTNGAPAGAIFQPKVVQLQYARLYDSGLLISAAIEDPTIGDFVLVDPRDVRLHRVPDFVARVRYQPLDGWGSLQFATLVRQFAYEDINRVEHFATGVSFSGNARFRTIGYNNVRFGVVGGEGAGSRVFGLAANPIAAGPVGAALEPLNNFGAFGSYQHFWTPCLWSNLAYGYASADLPPLMLGETHIAQNGWVNLIWNNPSGKIALGLEYYFGEREIGTGREGFNHHIQLSLQIGKGYISPAAESTAEFATSPAARAAPPDAPIAPPPPSRVYARL